MTPQPSHAFKSNLERYKVDPEQKGEATMRTACQMGKYTSVQRRWRPGETPGWVKVAPGGDLSIRDRCCDRLSPPFGRSVTGKVRTTAYRQTNRQRNYICKCTTRQRNQRRSVSVIKVTGKGWERYDGRERGSGQIGCHTWRTLVGECSLTLVGNQKYIKRENA